MIIFQNKRQRETDRKGKEREQERYEVVKMFMSDWDKDRAFLM